MKRLLALIPCVLAPVIAHAGAFVPTLLINVDTTTHEYYLAGSASGSPGVVSFGPPGLGPEMYQIFWDNYQTYDGGYADLLSESAFIISGNSGYNFTLFFHGNGNINGAFDFTSGAYTTITGDSSLRFSYAGWTPFMIAELEEKALNHEIVFPSVGETSFALQFVANPSSTSAIPEPSTAATLAGLAAFGCIGLRRRKR